MALLVKSARKLERADAVAHTDEISALCRAAIVLQCSHLEGYIKDLGEIAIARLYERSVARSKLSSSFFYFLSKDHFDEIRETADHGKLADKVFSFVDRDGELWSFDGPFPGQISYDRFSKGFASPSEKKIASFLGRFGATNFKRDLMRCLANDYPATSNMVSDMVTTRNNIAHGDATSSKTPGDVLVMIGFIKRYVAATDDVFASWCSANLCSIR